MHVELDAFRLVAGLFIAAIAVAVAVAVLLSTDWTPPSEAQRPADEPFPGFQSPK